MDRGRCFLSSLVSVMPKVVLCMIVSYLSLEYLFVSILWYPCSGLYAWKYWNVEQLEPDKPPQGCCKTLSNGFCYLKNRLYYVEPVIKLLKVILRLHKVILYMWWTICLVPQKYLSGDFRFTWCINIKEEGRLIYLNLNLSLCAPLALGSIQWNLHLMIPNLKFSLM
jgi:hypothetical protein